MDKAIDQQANGDESIDHEFDKLPRWARMLLCTLQDEIRQAKKREDRLLGIIESLSRGEANNSGINDPSRIENSLTYEIEKNFPEIKHFSIEIKEEELNVNLGVGGTKLRKEEVSRLSAFIKDFINCYGLRLYSSVNYTEGKLRE